MLCFFFCLSVCLFFPVIIILAAELLPCTRYHTIFASAAYNWLFVTSCFDCNSGGAMGAQVNKEGIIFLESLFSPLASVHNWRCQLSRSCVCCPVSGFFFFLTSQPSIVTACIFKNIMKRSRITVSGVAVSQQSGFSKETGYLAYLSPLFDAKILKLTPQKKRERKKNEDWVIWRFQPQGSRQKMIASKTSE